MGEAKGYKVRLWPDREKFTDVCRVLLSSSSLSLQNLSSGVVCNIHTAEKHTYPAIAWASDTINKDIVQISHDLRKAYCLELHEKISITRSEAMIEEAGEVTLCEVSQDNSDTTLPTLNEVECSHWAWLLEHSLSRVEKIVPGMIFNVKTKREERAFKILCINSSDQRLLYNTRESLVIKIVVASTRASISDGQILVIPAAQFGGLRDQIQQVNDIISIYNARNEFISELPTFFQPCQGGILLHGARGTGKSLMLQKICEAGWRKVYTIDNRIVGQSPMKTETAIKLIFANALQSQPSVIVIDALDAIASRSSTVGQILSQELEKLSGTRTIAIGATRSLSDIDQDLRSTGRFEIEIEMPIPDSNCRAEILKVLCGLPKDMLQTILDDIATRTHGFVGADLKKLLGHAVRRNEIRCGAYRSINGNKKGDSVKPEQLLDHMKDDFEEALLKVRPTAMQEIFVEIPNVKWSDIGGQDELKKRLEQAVVWPFKYANEMTTFGLTPKKGLLLYGPPGCSKTMTAKAIATESGLNFIPVRGAELLNMYVGESERAIREVFRKARAARPCIIFFDEFDAIGASRDGGQHGGIHTVTTLLNELDGFEELKGVFVLAATNKPEVIDPALIRAGRLSETLYVGLPNLEARKAILDIQIGTTNLADDVDTVALSNTTDGYSGAEIVAICQQARYAAFEEQISSGKPKDVSQRHFSTAMKRVEKSVTPEMTEEYEAWGKRRH